MKLGRASALGVFAGVHLAQCGPRSPVQGREIAQSLGTPHDYLVKILQQLVKAQIFSSERGPAGGFQLRKDPGEISLLEIVEAIEGPIDGLPVFLETIQTSRHAKSGFENTYSHMNRFARSLLGKTTLKDLVNGR